MSTFSSDLGRYCITPMWLIEATADQPRALVVWTYMNARWADRDTGACYPSRRTVAEALGMSVDTFDRCIAKLVEVGALEVTPRYDEKGDRSSNLYHFVTLPPGGRTAAATGGPTDAATGDRTAAAVSSNHGEGVISGKETPTSGKPDEGAPEGPPSAPGAGLVPMSNVESIDAKASRVGAVVMAAWCEATGRNPARTKLTADRRTKVKARLRDGFTEADLVAAVRGIALSPFHRGENDGGTRYDTIEVALRSGSQVEKFRDLLESGGDRRPASAVDRALDIAEGAGFFEEFGGSGQRGLEA